MRIKDILKSRGLTAKDVAATAGVTEAMLSNIANGKGNPSLQSLMKIADALGVSVAELFTDEINANKMVAFLHYRGRSHTPTTIAEIMAILKDWREEEFHELCHTHDFEHLRERYAENEAIQKLMDSLCALIGCPSDKKTNK